LGLIVLREGEHVPLASRGQQLYAIQDFDRQTCEATHALQIALEAVLRALQLPLRDGQLSLAGTGLCDRFRHFVPNGVECEKLVCLGLTDLGAPAALKRQIA
jgi:hypothetical protein